jgi:hypothetical protein
MQNETVHKKDKKLRTLLRTGGRKGARKDFIELLKRAINTSKESVS